MNLISKKLVFAPRALSLSIALAMAAVTGCADVGSDDADESAPDPQAQVVLDVDRDSTPESRGGGTPAVIDADRENHTPQSPWRRALEERRRRERERERERDRDQATDEDEADDDRSSDRVIGADRGTIFVGSDQR